MKQPTPGDEKESMFSEYLKETTVAAAVVILCMQALPVRAEGLLPGHLAGEISNSAHQNDDQHVVEITITNWYGGQIALAGHRVRFYAQSEILGQWLELACREDDASARSAGVVLARGEEWKIKVAVATPLTAADLYRNHEGDINVRFIYTVNFTEAANPWERKYAGEQLYWVTPKTGQWMLREGM